MITETYFLTFRRELAATLAAIGDAPGRRAFNAAIAAE